MRFIDFFAGIGGFRLGMEMAGHKCVGHCEIDKYADKSYRAMHEVKENEWYADDITRVKPRELPEADCYCFGFPCQAFSVAGKRRGFEVNSDAQLYKQAGNSVTVNVVYEIAKNLELTKEND